MQITKVKLEDGKTVIHYTDEVNAGVVTRETVYKCSEEQHPDFKKALEEVAPLAISLLGLDMDYVEGVSVRGVSFSENDHQGMGAVVTMLKELPGINAPFVMNTPHVHNAEKGGSLMPTALRNQLESVLREAEAFLKGKRAQGELFEQLDAAFPKTEAA